jgi:hypothetical protein
MARAAYSEHDGSKRHRAPVKGEISRWYNRIGATSARAT